MIPLDGSCLHPIFNFFGGVAEASMKEDEQGAHVELVDSLKVHARCGE